MFRTVLLVVALSATTAAFGAAAPASSASGPTLDVSKGTVLVSNGAQFVTAKPGQVLKAGDRVMVMQGAHATVNYGNGHTSALTPGTLADVGATNATTFAGRGLASQQKIGAMYAQAVGETDREKCRDGQGHDGQGHNGCAAADTDDGFILPVVSAVVIGSAIYLALHSAGNNHQSSISAP